MTEPDAQPDLEQPDTQVFRAAREERARARSLKARVSGVGSWRRRLAVVSMVVLGVVLTTIAIDVATSYGRVHPGVKVAGIPVGGLSAAEASAALDERFEERFEEPVSISFNKRRWDVLAGQVGLSVDTEALASMAMLVGRTGGLGTRISQRAKAWVGAADLPASGAADAVGMSGIINTIAQEIESPPRDAGVSVLDGELKLITAKDGIEIQREKLERDVVEMLVASDIRREIELPVEVTPAAVKDDAARAAMGTAEVMLQGPVEITFEDRAWILDEAEVADLVRFRPSSSASTGSAEATSAVALEAYIDAEETSRVVGPKIKNVGTPAQDARFEVDDGKVVLLAAKQGIGPDYALLAKTMTTILSKPDSERTIALRMGRTEPALTTERAKTFGIKERLAKYTTTYDGGNRPRVNNIHLLSDAINGTLVAPGDTFSFNDTIGPRTAEKGYKEANAIVNGQLVPQLGGGICQVGTTLFNAVFESGLPVVERKNHSFYISHYPKGRDATISWGGPDLRFTNDTANWVLVAASYTRGSVTIGIYGTDPGYEVDAEVGPWTGIIPFKVVEKKDSTLQIGRKAIEDAGVDGKTIIVKRIVKKDGKVIRTDTFKSLYKPKAQLLRVGTKPVTSTPATTAP